MAYHSWYGVSRVAPQADEEVTDLHRTRLLLNNAAQQVLANGLNLLGERTRAHVILSFQPPIRCHRAGGVSDAYKDS